MEEKKQEKEPEKPLKNAQEKIEKELGKKKSLFEYVIGLNVEYLRGLLGTKPEKVEELERDLRIAIASQPKGPHAALLNRALDRIGKIIDATIKSEGDVKGFGLIHFANAGLLDAEKVPKDKIEDTIEACDSALLQLDVIHAKQSQDVMPLSFFDIDPVDLGEKIQDFMKVLKERKESENK